MATKHCITIRSNTLTVLHDEWYQIYMYTTLLLYSKYDTYNDTHNGETNTSDTTICIKSTFVIGQIP